MALALEEIAPAPLPPPLKWAGGKRWLVPRLRNVWTSYQNCRLVEPFVGGLAVTLGLRPGSALLHDANPHLISFYRWLQRGLTEKATGICLTSADNDRKRFADYRQRFNELIETGNGESAEAAILFYYLNRTGFNGLCRFNNSGFFNVPFGRYKKIEYRDDFQPYTGALRGYEFSLGDFEVLEPRADDFIYADPPYDVEFTSYSAGGFDWTDQERLAIWLGRHPGPVVASNQATPRIRKLYKSLGFELEIVSAPRRISCDGNRDDAKEMLAFKNV